MRCARLLSRVSAELGALDRTGAERLVEVYPMAALRRWQVIDPSTPPSEWSYKGAAPGRQARREQHLARLQQLLDGAVEITDEVAARCVADDDDFDALICALVARACELQSTDPIPRGLRWLALREGWIHLPVAGTLSSLKSVTSAA